MRPTSRILVIATYLRAADPCVIKGKTVEMGLVLLPCQKTPVPIPMAFIRKDGRSHHYLTDTDFEEGRASLAVEIRRLRRIANMSQSSLAEAVGVSQVTVSRWEIGSATPRLSQIQKIASVFGVKTSALIGDSA